ncbi:hypothetical protein BDC45DRAFT_529727 [Circinella umbellata]|nr:hypothetical protein BDC45DRAFT_529727 [Circinella umbellata]
MRKLKILLSHTNGNAFSKLLGPLATEGITTDIALLKITDLYSLSQKTGISSQVLRALQQTVIHMTMTMKETEYQNGIKFSTGYPTLDDALYGGYELGQIIEIYGCVEKSKFVLKTIQTFLNDNPNATVHHIDASGTFEPRDLGDQNKQIMSRIHCYEAFTATELHQLLEQIKWDNVTTTKVSDMLCTMSSVRKLSLSILMVRTAQSSDEFSSNKSIVQMWDSCIDLRIHLQQQQQQQQTPLTSKRMMLSNRYQCDIDKARIPVTYTLN